MTDPLVGEDGRPRCSWARHPLEVAYHDERWGVPLRDDRELFAMLVLEGAQAGLSWLTILKKEEGYRRAFAEFDTDVLAAWGEDEVPALLQDPGIVRNRLKVTSTLDNARALAALEPHGGLGAWAWDRVGGTPLQHTWPRLEDLPAETPLSRTMSRELKGLGFRFVGPTIVYAWMQAAGMVNDHVTGCFRWAELGGRPAPAPGV